VVDSYSTDKTLELAVALGAKVVQHPFRGFTAQKNYAVTQAQYDLILSLDADEYLSDTLVASILEVKTSATASGYTFNRLNYFKGQSIKSCGWYPDAKIRMWDRRKGQWVGDLLHEVVALDKGAATRHLAGDLHHDAYGSVAELVAKMQKYSDIYAQEHAFKKNVTTFKVLYKAVAAFFKNYILQGGILDGYAGLVIAASNANGVFYKYAKVLEVNRMFTITLIVTTYRRPDALKQVLLSAIDQSLLPKEVIVADDGSRSDTRDTVEALAATYPIPLKYVWQEDIGFRAARARNLGTLAAQGEYIIFIDGDCVPQKDFVANHRRLAKRGYVVTGSRVLLSEAYTRRVLDQHLDIQQLGALEKLKLYLAGNANKFLQTMLHLPDLGRESKRFTWRRIKSCNMAAWRSDLDLVNGFDESFTGWGHEDSDLVLRLFNAGVLRKSGAFATEVYHLWHREAKRDQESSNRSVVLQRAIDKTTQAVTGLRELRASVA